jgi:hypothetical protein
MSLIGNIVSRFYKKPNKEVSSVNKLIFSIDENGKHWIDIKINNDTDKSCEQFAKLLYNLNSGAYKLSIIDFLISTPDKQPQIKSYIDNIIMFWGILIESNENNTLGIGKSEKEPFVSPRNVFLGRDK